MYTLIKHHTMKTHDGEDIYLQASLTLVLDGSEWSASHPLTSTPSQGKSPQYPSDRRLGGPQSQSGHGGTDKNPFPAPDGNWTLVTQPTA
jgi:hypothetical protein